MIADAPVVRGTLNGLDALQRQGEAERIAQSLQDRARVRRAIRRTPIGIR